ncbi:BTAD domain-containing putative transcriptional regulator [Hamadaea tsunoensis]|uniref:BTAD domain-containing putative transcriptional regulator n=1 Tax=Hamadaea tsunoensis TaxID=53368 RepID=UPI0004229CF3|nr:BTAD domain-containing putative transcriptional regulator [Hamadaea tsunoensis]
MPGGEDGLKLSILGDVTASNGGRLIDLGGRRQRAVLALLLLGRGDVIAADHLIDSLWGEDVPPSASGALQAYISHLRRRLEPEGTARARGNIIASKGGGYALALDEDAVDAWRFESLVRTAGTVDPQAATAALTAALALWRGPALAEYADRPWAQPEAIRLAGLRGVAREQLVAARLATGESAVLVPGLEALVAEEPLREERWRLLVLALYRAHRQGDALAALRRARQTLADELGVDPGPALRALEAEVLAQSPALDLAPPTVTVTVGEPVPVPPAGRAGGDDVLFDRELELAEIRACLGDALSGQARLLLVEGRAGIGKTRLLIEARRLAAERGLSSLAARGSQIEKEYGFGAVRQLFEPLLADPGRRDGLLLGSALSAAAVFDVAGMGGGAEPQQRTDNLLATLHGLYRLTANLCADGPLVLSIDDLQWCDSGSLRFLAYLVRRLEGLPILIVATLRTGEPHDDEALLAELMHDPSTVRVQPSALTEHGVAGLVDRVLGRAEPAFVTTCHRVTMGNPLLLRQLLRALQAEGVRPDAAHADTVIAIGSRAVSSMVLMRLARLPEATTATARAVAVLGNGAALPAVAALSGLAETDAVNAIAVLARAEVLRDEYPLSFVHPLVADAVYRDLPPGERQLHHERAARVLAAAGAQAEQVAAHLLQVPHRRDPWTVGILRAAAARAAGRGAADAAVTYLLRALAEPPTPEERPDVLLELGLIEATMDGLAAVGHLREAYEILTDPVRRADVALTLVRALVFAGARGEGTAVARRIMAELPDDLVDARQGLTGLARLCGYMHGLEESEWRSGPVPEIVGTGPGARMLASALAWEGVVDGVDRHRAVELARFAVADGVLLRVDTGLLWIVATVVLQAADEDADALWAQGSVFSYEQGSLFGLLSVHLWEAWGKLCHGNLQEAFEGLLTSKEQQTMWGSLIGQAYNDAYLVLAQLELGDVAGARDFADSVRDRGSFGDGARLNYEAQACVELAEGRPAAALSSLDEARRCQPEHDNPAWWPGRSLRATALAALGRPAEALALAEQEVEHARRWGAPRVLGRSLRILGELRGADGRADLEEALALLSAGRARLEHARVLAALARIGPERETIPLLEQAYALAQRCGAAGLARDVAAEFERRGAAVPPVEGTAALTAVERRMLAMAAEGAGAREIAQALFITPRLVQTMLAAVRQRRDGRG